jgi:hypothetical protein
MNLAQGRRMLESKRFFGRLAACVLVASATAMAQAPAPEQVPEGVQAQRLLDKADAALSAGDDVQARGRYQEERRSGSASPPGRRSTS